MQKTLLDIKSAVFIASNNSMAGFNKNVSSLPINFLSRNVLQNKQNYFDELLHQKNNIM